MGHGPYKGRALEAQILELHAEGLTNREIGKRLDFDHSAVSYWLRKHGKKSAWASQPVNKISDTEAICYKCEQTKPLVEFQHGRRGQQYEYTFSYCKDCRTKQTRLSMNNNIDRFLNDRWRRLAIRCSKLGIEMTLSKEYFIALYHKQQGLCFYTDRKLDCIVGREQGYGGTRNSLSIDKIIPEKGYVEGNVVFCTNQANTVKSDVSLDEMREWMPGWYDRVVKMWRDLGLVCFQVAAGDF